MSPEQVRGHEADHRSDLFSLGCVLYEMVGGRRAFEGDSGADIMAAIITREPETLSSSGVDVPPDLELAIERCLEKSPEARFQSAADLAFVLRASVTDTDAVRAAPTERVRTRWRVPITVAAALAVVAIGFWIVVGGRSIVPPEQVTEFEPNRVVVAEFENRIDDSGFDDFGSHVADSITALLRQVGRLTVATNPHRFGAQQAGRQDEPGGADPLRRLAESTRSGLVVTGACYASGDQVEIRARIVDPWQDEVRQSFDAVRAPRSDPSSAVDLLSQRVAGTLALHFNNLVPLGLSRPVQLAAYREFEGALDHWGIYRASMISGLERALEFEPTFVLARSYLFRWYLFQRMFDEAEAAVKVLESQLPALTPFDRLAVVDARARLHGRPLEALRATREAVALAPDSHWFLLHLGREAIAVNRPREAVEALSRIPYDWTSGGTAFASAPFYELCFAYHMLGDYEAQLRVAADSVEHFPDRMVFYGLQCNALAAMGRFEEMDDIIEESLTISVRGSTWGSSQTFTARELRAHGHRERSLELAERIVEWYRERPDEIREFQWWYAATLNVAERWDEAREVVERLARDDPERVRHPGLLGVLEARIGRTDEARRIAEQLLDSGNEYSRADRAYWRGCIAAQLGQLDEAMGLTQLSASEGGVYGDEVHRDINLEPLWDHPAFQELIRPKG
jgi:tetratricopeptide (TPR) repeat protein